jgi:hypothetical protein
MHPEEAMVEVAKASSGPPVPRGESIEVIAVKREFTGSELRKAFELTQKVDGTSEEELGGIDQELLMERVVDFTQWVMATMPRRIEKTRAELIKYGNDPAQAVNLMVEAQIGAALTFGMRLRWQLDRLDG